MIKQRTLQSIAKLKGVGLHSGVDVDLTIKPAPINTGIVFKRTDLSPEKEILAQVENVESTVLSTSLCKDGVVISTIEHLLAAFSGMWIDNAYVELNANEVPIMDGSADTFVQLIQKAGIVEQNALKKFIRIKKTLEINTEDRWVRLEPAETFKITFDIDFDHPFFAKIQRYAEVDFAKTSFINEVSPARTFGFLSQYEILKANNLALGASLENVVVIGENAVLNESGLRFEDELVKHKILDVVGDLYLLGKRIVGHFIGHKSGHKMHIELVKMLMNDSTAWEIVNFPKQQDVDNFVVDVQLSDAN